VDPTVRQPAERQATAGPAHFSSRPLFEFEFRFNVFQLGLLSDALLEIKYFQIYWAKIYEMGMAGKLRVLSTQLHWFDTLDQL
jgi:hypothetical protein